MKVVIERSTVPQQGDYAKYVTQNQELRFQVISNIYYMRVT